MLNLTQQKLSPCHDKGNHQNSLTLLDSFCFHGSAFCGVLGLWHGQTYCWLRCHIHCRLKSCEENWSEVMGRKAALLLPISFKDTASHCMGTPWQHQEAIGKFIVHLCTWLSQVSRNPVARQEKANRAPNVCLFLLSDSHQISPEGDSWLSLSFELLLMSPDEHYRFY